MRFKTSCVANNDARFAIEVGMMWEAEHRKVLNKTGD